MPSVTLRPNATSVSPDAYAAWTGESATVVGDQNDATYLYALNALRDSSFNFPDQSWAANTIINSVTVYARAKYSGPDTIYYGGMQPNGITVDIYSGATKIFTGGVNKVSITKSWNNFTVGTFNTRMTGGAAITAADINAMIANVISSVYPSGYQVEVAEIWVIVDYNQPSTISGTAPNATVTTATPTFTVTHTDADGEIADAYRARIVKWKDIASYANSWNIFNDASTPMAYDSGVVPIAVPSGSSISIVPPTPLENFTEYRCYVQTYAGGVWSQPTKTDSYAYAVTKFPQPSAPDITNVIPEDDENNILVLMTQRENQAGPNQSDQISSLADWTAKSNCTLSRYTTSGGVAKYDGIVGPALDVLSSAAGDYEIGTSEVAPPWDVTIGDQWSASIMVTPVGFAGSAGTETARRARMDILWFNASNVLLSQHLGREQHIVVGEWVNVHCTSKKPAGATKAGVKVRFLGTAAASERHFASSFQMKQGPLNLARDPLLRIDTDGNGLADILTSYRWPGSGSAPTYTLDSAPPADALFANDTVQKIVIPSGNADGWVGFRESYRLAKGSIYTVHLWVYSDRAINTDLFIDTVYPNVLWPTQSIPANQLTHIERTFITRDTAANLNHIYYRFGGMGGAATNIWVGAIMVEPADKSVESRVSNAFGGFESGVGTFVALNNATINQQTPQASQDANSLRIITSGSTSTDADIGATLGGTNGYIVTPNEQILCQFQIAPDTGAMARTIELWAHWFQTGGTASATGPTKIATLVETTNTYKDIRGTAIAPPDAGRCQIKVVIKNAGVTTHYLDNFQFIVGDPTTGLFNPEFFTLGGFTSTARYLELQKLSGSGVWEPMHGLPPIDEGASGSSFVNLAAIDYFQKPGEEVWYRVRAKSTDTYGNIAYSVWSEIFRSDGLEALTKVWLKSISDPTKNLSINLTDWKIDFTVQKQRTTHMPLGSDKPIVISGRRRSVNFPFTIYCATADIYDEVVELLDADQAMLLQLPKRQLWVNLAGDYVERQFTRDKIGDTDDTVIAGTFQEVRAPI